MKNHCCQVSLCTLSARTSVTIVHFVHALSPIVLAVLCKQRLRTIIICAFPLTLCHIRNYDFCVSCVFMYFMYVSCTSINNYTAFVLV